MSRSKASAIKEKETKSQILTTIAEVTGLKKKEVQSVLAAVRDHAVRHLNARGSGEFSVPEVGIKLRRVKKPARKAGMAKNPFTGEMVKVEARPASLSVRASALKGLKDLVAG
ncbi:MAG: HU family DNA-binding protein [Gammaproteobacteria bacterium]|jgi:nucleoid DNA-binding protein|nr:HU family DNA-binding protein [Gammaproteobacteria bacterium]MBI5615659.1 HU family DNA-binding protein [Gammaproteobacteria bacterium]